MSVQEKQKEMEEIQQYLEGLNKGEVELDEKTLAGMLAKLDHAASIADGLETRVDGLLSELDETLQGLEESHQPTEQETKVEDGSAKS